MRKILQMSEDKLIQGSSSFRHESHHRHYQRKLEGVIKDTVFFSTTNTAIVDTYKIGLYESEISANSENSSTAELLQSLEDHFDAFHPLGSKSFIAYHISSPTLSILPREIRDIIYIDLIVADDLSILQTSKAVCREVTQLLYRRGTCRIVTRYEPTQGGGGLRFQKPPTVRDPESRYPPLAGRCTLRRIYSSPRCSAALP